MVPDDREFLCRRPNRISLSTLPNPIRLLPNPLDPRRDNVPPFRQAGVQKLPILKFRTHTQMMLCQKLGVDLGLFCANRRLPYRSNLIASLLVSHGSYFDSRDFFWSLSYYSPAFRSALGILSIGATIPSLGPLHTTCHAAPVT